MPVSFGVDGHPAVAIPLAAPGLRRGPSQRRRSDPSRGPPRDFPRQLRVGDGSDSALTSGRSAAAGSLKILCQIDFPELLPEGAARRCREPRPGGIPVATFRARSRSWSMSSPTSLVGAAAPASRSRRARSWSKSPRRPVRRWIQERFGGQSAEPASSWSSVPAGRRAHPLHASPTPHARAGAATRGAPARRGHDHPDTPPTESHYGRPRELSLEHFVIGDSNRLAHAAALTVAECPPKPTIRSSSTVARTSERPTFARIASLTTEHHPRPQRPCHHRRVLHERVPRGPLLRRGMGRFKSPLPRHRRAAASTTSRSSSARPAPRRSSSIPSTPSTNRRLSLLPTPPISCLPATCKRSKTAYASASRPASSPISTPPTSTHVSPSSASASTKTGSTTSSPAPPGGDRPSASPLDVRALEGALIRVVAFSSLTGRPLTGEARPLRCSTGSTLAHPAHNTQTLADIQAAACRHFGLSSRGATLSRRTARVAWPRQVAMYLARELTDESLPAIGRHPLPDGATTQPSCTPYVALSRDHADSTSRKAVDDVRCALETRDS